MIVVSHDVNTMPGQAFNRLTSGRPVAGVLMVQQTYPIAPIIDSILLIWAASEAEEWHSQVCFLSL